MCIDINPKVRVFSFKWLLIHDLLNSIHIWLLWVYMMAMLQFIICKPNQVLLFTNHPHKMESTEMLFGRLGTLKLVFVDILWIKPTYLKVVWAEDNLDGYLNFYSASADGRVTNWTIVKNNLWFSDILEIPFNKHLAHLENVNFTVSGWVI